ncbi:hypothetical protein [Leptolyngbya sp. FACHB-16]|uniref:hypothetical protein n=1 Tax=unclassified Leptolyngbya TaxID=2650499 RepID=UPI0016837277|nr:hypothetical protein [Leptolyngbya sp. FACHB-16]MBD1913651.1 hypothetical protein [Leptolyngbya sp. FACHB-8]MBD2158249.1 hypothetical protein [Leptolyngbya sp. FACHB-16]
MVEATGYLRNSMAGLAGTVCYGEGITQVRYKKDKIRNSELFFSLEKSYFGIANNAMFI